MVNMKFLHSNNENCHINSQFYAFFALWNERILVNFSSTLSPHAGFDPHLAEKTRAKHADSHTREEQEWASVDRVLHAEVWKFYSNVDTGKPSPSGGSVNAPPSTTTSTDVVVNKQQTSMEAMGRILGIERADMNIGASSLGEMASAQQQQLIRNRSTNGKWFCPFTKEQILKIWRTPRQFLKGDDELRTLKYLLRFNGAYASYMEQIADREARSKNAAKAGHHINWGGYGGTPPADVDVRARMVLKEIDRTSLCKTAWMDTSVLHSNNQRFPTAVLHTMLEEELDNILIEQIKERERNDRVRIADESDDDDDSGGSDESEFDDNGNDIVILKKIQARAARREKRRQHLVQDDQKAQVHQAKKLVGLKGKSGEALEMARLQNKLGKNNLCVCFYCSFLLL